MDSEPPSGYSTYGTLGQYFITGNFSPNDDAGNAPPEFEELASASPAVLSVDSSTTLAVSAFDIDGDDLNYLWSKLSGPGNVNFGNNTASSTSADFDSEGVYELSVTVSDGQAS